MKIGIDISQTLYENTGVAQYLKHLVSQLILEDTQNEYTLFFSSLRQKVPNFFLEIENNHKDRVQVKSFKFSPMMLDFIWNKLHIMPIETCLGTIDVFISSDWAEPPVKKAKKATILYDTIVYKFPEETHRKIVEVQKRKLKWVKKESSIIFCISDSTRKDAHEVLGIEEKRLKVIYPGITI